MPTTFVPAKTGYSRVFLIEGGARADHAPTYESCWKAAGLTQAEGDITKIECPDPYAFNKFITIGETQGVEERPTISVTGRMSADTESKMLRLTRQRCEQDIAIHFGACTDPSQFNTFTKAIVLESALFTNYSTDDLGALSSDEANPVNETIDTSSRLVYEQLPMSFSERGQDAVVNPLVDVVICDSPTCGECADPSDGCYHAYAVNSGSSGSPGTPPDLVYTTDKGVNWDPDDIDALGAGGTADAVACLGDYVAVVSHAGDTLVYKDKSDIGTIVGGWTAIATGIVAAGSPTDAFAVGGYMFVCGDGGYVYGTDDVTAGLTVLDAGTTTVQDLKAVHSISEYNAVAVGAAGAVIYTEDQVTWTLATAPVAATLNCVWMKTESEWWVGSAAGILYFTVDKGVTWTTKALPGANYASITDIAFSNKLTGFISANLTTTKGRLLRTYNGGYSWKVLPDTATGTMTAADTFDAIAACPYDPNYVIAVGTADNGTDGIIVTGND